MGNKMGNCSYRCIQIFCSSHLRMRWLKTAGIILNTMVICAFWWCIVVGVVLSLMLNDIISAPTQSYASLPVLIFMTGALGLIVSLPAFNCFKNQGKCGLITYVCMLWITTISVLAGAVQLIMVSEDDGKLFDWVDLALKEVFDKAADSVTGMEAVFLIENQFLCCGFNGISDYENAYLPPGCCEAPTDVCTDVNAYTKPCRDAFVESFQYKFKDFGISLVFAVLVLSAAIINTFLMLAKLRCDEDESESK
ncbi:unnamed protein product [Hymenolepis diminuta]|uniref:Tetraspanin n=2 Tax=Hymenolepis diminuta TaxID=6216 RepID=A0A564YA51_HYMDI|nr:unnamed protein product [Hymenolepis diminuta]